MNNGLEILRAKLSKLHDSANERTLYPLICEFIQSCISKDFGGPYVATSEESLSVEDKNIGFPDITVRKDSGRLVGWWEIKLRNDSLSKEAFTDQFGKYKDSLENILFTNLKEWQLWQWDSEGKPQKVDELNFDVLAFGIGEEKKLENLLIKFYEGRPFEAKTPKQLALALARKTRLLSKQVEEAYNEKDKKSDMVKLKRTFEKTLIQNITVHQFSNMIAETLAYSLFLAFLEHIHRGNGSQITLQTAIEYLPTNVPVLKDLYQLINKVSSTIPEVYKATLSVLEQLEVSDIKRIYQKLVEHKTGEDPVIQFYEPFLKEYDPKEREARGVYYTPKPIVDYIVRSVDWILRNKFEKKKGLADESVQLLDPATGTGTFLMSAIQEIHQNINKEYGSISEELVKKEFNRVVLEHILKHFYGFELMIAPYAIAHLKLTLEIERLGFDFSLTKTDKDPGNDRFKVYLANTLDNPKQVPQDFFGFSSIPKESEHARTIKNNVPILAIIGNPPYSNFGQMNQGEWILGLIDVYKKGLNEKKINLDDDFIKFIRFAEWKLQQTGMGIVAMITSNTFIDGITHRRMRQSLLETYDEIYIYNLHGNLRKKEVCPDGSLDENVFENKIQSGVSINIFIKYPEHKKQTVVYHEDLWGTYKYKWDTLLGQEFSATKWNTVDVASFNKQFSQTRWGKAFGDNLNFFVPKEAEKMLEYGSFVGIHQLFPLFNSGIITRNDNATIYYTKEELEHVLNDIENLRLEDVRNKYQIKDGVSWKLKDAKDDVINNKSDNNIAEILYRPFDKRFTLFTKKSSGFLNRPIYDVMKNLTNQNLALLCKRQQIQDFSYALVTSCITESCVFESAYANNSVMPLYTFNDGDQQSLLMTENKVCNIDPGLIKEFCDALNLKFVQLGQGDLAKTFGPEDIFYYVYAILHSPTYRTRYSEQLKIDFPRFPLTTNNNIFKNLVGFGKKLTNLHLLGENPFDVTKSIFDDSSQWGITPITSNANENISDWQVTDITYDEANKRVYVNSNQYFSGIEKDIWEFIVGGYQVCDKWLRVRKQSNKSLSVDDIRHYIKICVSLRESIKVMKEIDQAIPSWPIK